MQLLRTKDAHEETQEILLDKKLNFQSREKGFLQTNTQGEIWNDKLNSNKQNTTEVQRSKQEPLFSVDQRPAARPEKLKADAWRRDVHDKLQNKGSSGMLVLSKTLRIVRFIQKEDWSWSSLEILKELENELKMLEKILIAKNEMIEDLEKKIRVEKDTIDVLTKVLENQNSVVPRYPFREKDTLEEPEFEVPKEYDQEKPQVIYQSTGSLDSIKSENDLRDPNVKSPFTSNINTQHADEYVEERRRSLAKTRRLLELEHRRLSTSKNSDRLEAETRRRSSVSAEQYNKTKHMDYKRKWDHELVSVLSRSHSQEEGLDEEELPQQTPANSPTPSTPKVVQNIAGADIIVSKEIPKEVEARDKQVIAKQWKHIYNLQRKLKNLENNARKEIEILQHQMALKNLQERPIEENLIQSEVIAWKQKYWKVAYNEQKRGQKIDELQEELEETRDKFLEASKWRGYKPEEKAVLQAGSKMSDDEFGAVIQLIETVSESHSNELIELHRANDAIVVELQHKVQQIAHEKSDIASEFAEKTKELNQMTRHQQTINHLQAQLEVTQSSLHTKQNEVSEMKKAHGKILSDIKMSKLEFIKQSVIEIERLKSVIRSYNSKFKNPARSVTNTWLAGWI